MTFDFFGLFRKKAYKIQPTVLVVLDGLGVAPESKGNPVTQAKTPNLDYLKSNFFYTTLTASGEAVGLPANEVGNSEVGHLTIGAGRVVFQHLKRINSQIQDGTFFENKALLRLSSHLATYKSKLHIAGLVSSGNVHSSLEHLFALLRFCLQNDIKNVYLHLFTDGRDAPPEEGIAIVEKVQKYIKDVKVGAIAIISGRYYAMDRDRRWERTEKAYKAMVLGEGPKAQDPISAIKSSYAQGTTDEFIIPTVITQADGIPIATVDDNDGFVFFNFRVDRPLQLTMAFTIPLFEELKSFKFGYVPYKEKEEGEVKFAGTFQRVKFPKNLFFTTMTEYHKDLPVSAVVCGPFSVDKSLPEVLAEAGLKQVHLAESEKQRMVTYYFDGLREEPFVNEEVLIVPSPKVPTYDKKPEMAALKILDDFKKAMNKDIYNFYIINFANPDMVAHTGDIEATVAAIETVDKALAEIVRLVSRVRGKLVITADHGNAEELLTYSTKSFFFTSGAGSVNTDHSDNPVPFIVADFSLPSGAKRLPAGTLSDIAPTILGLLGIGVPTLMTGKNLLLPHPPDGVVTKTKDGNLKIPEVPKDGV